MKSGFERIGREVTLQQAKRSCLDKVVYQSKNAARDRAVYLASKYPNSKPMRPYRCSLCSHFHLTTTVPRSLEFRPKEDRAA